MEELFFRGLLLRSIADARPDTAWAIVGSSVFFGLAHPNDLPVEAADPGDGPPSPSSAVVLAILAVTHGPPGRRRSSPTPSSTLFTLLYLTFTG